jgi:hypothetical protein
VSLGPAALVRSLPAALGRTPAEELVLVGVSGLSLSAAVIMTLPLEAEIRARELELELADVINAGLEQLVRDGATKVAVLIYSDDPSPDSTVARYGATAVVAAEAAGLGVLDAITVANGRWRSYECDNPSCCPPEGNPITEGPTP